MNRAWSTWTASGSIRDAVSNARYQAFLDDVGDSKVYAHPDEPPGKDYTPAHFRDPRFNGRNSRWLGVDWYDAYAFCLWAGASCRANWSGKKRPAATDGRPYPWGMWDPSKAHHVERSFGVRVQSLEELETLVVSVTLDYPAEPVLPVDALPEGASPYGLRHT